MAIDKLTPQYLNSDTDQKLVKSVEMTDNLNVRVSNDDEGTAGVVKNIKGTTVVGAKTNDDAFPTGTNRVIGSVANETNKEIIFLLYNEHANRNHGIYRLDMITGKYEKVYEDSVLNFRKYTHTDCDVIVNEDNETLFYWTDDVNPPMKVNINRLMRKEYPFQATGYSGTDEDKLLSLTVAKQPPLNAPTFNYVNNSSLGFNNIYEKNFQFAYKYKYQDGELSALSPYSAMSVSITQLKDGLIEQSTKDFYNQINVFVQNSSADVKEIILYAKNVNTETFYEIEKIINTGVSGGISTVKFIDDKISSALSVDEVNKIYDNVPQVAKSQAIAKNRLMYGNYKEGYENVDLNVETNPVYSDVTNIFKIKVSHSGTSDVLRTKENPAGIGGIVDFDIDFSELPSSLSSTDKVFLEFSVLIDEFEFQRAGFFSGDSFGDIEVDFKNPEHDRLEQETIPCASSIGIITLSIQEINISKIFSFSQTTSKANFITEVSSYLSSNYFAGAVGSNKELKYGTPNNPLLSANNTFWLAGISYFIFNEQSKSSDILTVNLNFSGAEVFINELNIDGSAFLNPFGNFEPVEVLNSSTLIIGGESAYNKYDSNSDAKEVGYRKYEDYMVSGNASFGGSLNGQKTFKSNSNHSFGIVYLDDRGRAGGVNKINDVFVKPFYNRDKKGKTEIDFRIKNTPPIWAKKWMPVYAENATYNDYIQYTTGEAYVALSEREEGGSGLSKRLYISMSTLEGSESSFKEQTGANLEYKFEEGDIAKIISYKNANGNTVYPARYNFDVVDYKYFTEEEAKIFLNRTGANTNAGWFLILNSENHTNFSYEDVITNTDFWSSESIIEIQKPKKEIKEKIYYGLGKTYDIKTISGETVHEGDRSVSSQPSGSITITPSSETAGGTFTSTTRFFVGDTMSVDSTTIRVTDVFVETDGTYSYNYTSPTAVSEQTVSVNVLNYEDGVITIKQGDGYFRVRRLRISDTFNYEELPEKLKRNRYSYTGGYVEDKSVSDFFSSKRVTTGKPYAYIPDAKTIRRKSSITYSDVYSLDSDRLNLSSFNLSLANWTDLDIMFGGVQAMVNRGDALTVIQENKASQLPISRQLLEYASGDAGVSVSKNVLGIPSYYAGDFGTENPESVVERFGVVYYVDYKAAKVIRLSADGITVISDKGMNSFFETEFKKLVSSSKSARVVGGFDPDAEEYLVTVEPVFKTTITIGTDSPLDVPSDINGGLSGFGLQFVDNPVIWGLWGHNWEEFCGNWEDIGNGIVFVDAAYGTQSILVDNVFQGSTGVINVIITDTAYSFSAIGTLDLSTMKVTMPSETCTGVAITVPAEPVEEEEGFTIAYKHKDGVWGSKYSFRPTMYVNINNELYSFFYTNSGLMWKHNESSTRNNFYGTQYNSIIEAVSNFNPSMIKVFEALGIEGNGVWSGVLTTSDQSTTIETTDFDEREGHKYSMIFRDTVDSQSNKTYLGKISNVSNNEITFTSPVHKVPFVKGDTLRIADVNSLNNSNETITGLVSRNKISVSDDTPFSVNDEIFVKNNARVSGDPMRDVFLKIKLTSSDTSPFEVHALSVSFDRSRLHNDKVN
jgi:hypothetical protein